MGHQRPVDTPAAVAPCPLGSESGHSVHAAACLLGAISGQMHRNKTACAGFVRFYSAASSRGRTPRDFAER